MDEPAYKGVMLSNPPGGNDGAYATTYNGEAYAAASAPPFLAPGKPYEQLGLPPTSKVRGAVPYKRESIVTKHRRWLSQWKKKAAAKRETRELAASGGGRESHPKLNAFAEKLRKDILAGEDVSYWKPAQQAKEVKAELEASIARAAEGAEGGKDGAEGGGEGDLASLDAELEAFVTGAIEARAVPAPAEGGSAVGGKAGAGAGPKAGKKVVLAKPAWARTEEDEQLVEEAEVDDLLSFAEGLDYDKLIEDMDNEDMRDAIKTMQEAETEARTTGAPLTESWKKGFVRAMNHMAGVDAVGAGDGGGPGSAMEQDMAGSTVTGVTAVSKARADAIAKERAERASKAEEPQWDRSTTVGQKEEEGIKLEGIRAAEEFLRENPELKSVHSVGSARAALEKAATPVLPATPVACS